MRWSLPQRLGSAETGAKRVGRQIRIGRLVMCMLVLRRLVLLVPRIQRVNVRATRVVVKYELICGCIARLTLRPHRTDRCLRLRLRLIRPLQLRLELSLILRQGMGLRLIVRSESAVFGRLRSQCRQRVERDLTGRINRTLRLLDWPSVSDGVKSGRETIRE